MKLDNELWVGKQWSVTIYGIECRHGNYEISVDSIRGGICGRKLADHIFLDHMATKLWVNLDDFCLAWVAALHLHKINMAQDNWPHMMARIAKLRAKRVVDIEHHILFEEIGEQLYPGKFVWSPEELEIVCDAVDRIMGINEP